MHSTFSFPDYEESEESAELISKAVALCLKIWGCLSKSFQADQNFGSSFEESVVDTTSPETMM